MKTLIVHPEDSTTAFLSQTYAHLSNKTVVQCGVTKSKFRELIESHGRVIMLGHGSPCGLWNSGQFSDAGLYIIDESMVVPLKSKPNSIYIWCHADQFVRNNRLAGLNCGMFISEKREAFENGFDNIDTDLIDQSNERFVTVLSKHINGPLNVLYQKLMSNYKSLARTNPIARFNVERLYLTSPGANENYIKELASLEEFLNRFLETQW